MVSRDETGRGRQAGSIIAPRFGVLSYLAEKALTAADVIYMPIVQELIRAGQRDDARALNLDFDDFSRTYPAITSWLGRIESLEEYDRAYPPHWRES